MVMMYHMSLITKEVGSFLFVQPPPPPPVRYAPPGTHYVSLPSKSLTKNMALPSEGANNMHPLSYGGGGHKRKRSKRYLLTVGGVHPFSDVK